jgi:hypothetical protein
MLFHFLHSSTDDHHHPFIFVLFFFISLYLHISFFFFTLPESMAGDGVRVRSRGMFALANAAGAPAPSAGGPVTFGVSGPRSAALGIGPFVDGGLCHLFVDMPHAHQRSLAALVGVAPDAIVAELKWIEETVDGMF